MKRSPLVLSLLLFGLLLTGIVAIGCKEYDVDDTNYGNILRVTATPTGAEEVPAVSTPGSGTLEAELDKTTKVLRYRLTWNNLKDSAILAHFHGPASPGQNAGVLINIFLTRRASSGTISDTTTLSDTNYQLFLDRKMYVNVHSKVHPGGEIRGQVTVQ
ncbi:MAG: CHRD domain-containing protein [Flavisolibacter sp.]|nr:CHRD domain-containing protein [Flavisolibacter sp.]